MFIVEWTGGGDYKLLGHGELFLNQEKFNSSLGPGHNNEESIRWDLK